MTSLHFMGKKKVKIRLFFLQNSYVVQQEKNGLLSCVQPLEFE